ncbi:MAG TPA: hypothetical protein VFR81_21775 [Longimicrobium sp.]|nr:hypothetical protein [Longimicrobium sp.]
MRHPMLEASFAVFVLFFGLPMMDALRARDWASAAFWVAVCAAFLWMGRPRHQTGRMDRSRRRRAT